MVGRGEQGAVSQTFTSGLCVFGVIIIPLLPIAVFIYPALANFLELPDYLFREFYIAYIFAALGMMLSFLTSALVALPKGLLKTTLPVIVHFMCGLMQIVIIVYMLNEGFGVVSLGVAVFIRFLISTVINVINSFNLLLKRELRESGLVPKISIIRGYFTVLPAMFFSRLTTGMVSKIEPTIILKFLGPELAASYSITKAAAMVLTGLVNSVTASVFPSLSMVFGESDHARKEAVLLRSLELISCAIILYFGGYVLLNMHFVSLWVGNDFFLGSKLSGAIGVSLAAVTTTNFLNNALMAYGDISYSSWLRILEEILRFLLLVLGVILFGVYGLPLAGFLAAVFGGVAYCLRVRKKLGVEIFSAHNIRSFNLLIVVAPLLMIFSISAEHIALATWSSFFCGLVIITLMLIGFCALFSGLCRLHFLGLFKSICAKVSR